MHDVAIVGAGPSGTSTALHLLAARPATRVLLLDRSTFPREKICAGAVGARGLQALTAIGVDLAPVPDRVDVRGLGVVTPFGRLHARHDEPIGWVVRRASFDAHLLAAARDRGVEVRSGVKVTGVAARGHGVELRTSAGPLEARCVVGADGVGSVVRRCLGFEAGDVHAQAVEVDAPWCAADRAPDVLWFDLTEGGFPGYAWDFATIADGRPRVSRGVYQIVRGAPGATRDPDPAERLRRRLRRVGLDPKALRFKRFAERGLPLHRPASRERVLLVGEAAGIDPVLGEGIAQAILYGAVAGPYLAQALDRKDLRFADWRSALRGTRLGLDLAARRLALPALYHPRSRPTVERWVSRSVPLARAGGRYFGGRRMSRLDLARALTQLAGAV